MTKTQKENKKVIESFHEALNALDFEKVEDLLADNATMGGPGAERVQGAKQITESLIESLITNLKMKSLRCEILSIDAVGPYIVDDRIDWGEYGDEKVKVGAHVSGSYIVENGKILDWTEWLSPEAGEALANVAPDWQA